MSSKGRTRPYPERSTGSADPLCSSFGSRRYEDAVGTYRDIWRRARSPLLRALACNAEGLLLLHTPASVAPGSAERRFRTGDAVLAPWAEDGGEYAATLRSVDAAAGECTVDWADGGTTHRVVPLASLTTLEGEVCASASSGQAVEVRQWAARRAIRRALHAWEMQAELGVAHDAFVDLAGLLCDAARTEARAALVSVGPSGRGLPEALAAARRHLQRARWSSERAYAPDPRAMAATCVHRAELCRLAAGLPPEAARAASSSGATAPLELVAEALQLHQRAAAHLAAAAGGWRRSPSAAEEDSSNRWLPPGGSLPPEAVQQLLWAKALATHVALAPPSTGKATGPARRGGMARPHHVPRRARASTAGGPAPEASAFSLPEKLLPSHAGAPGVKGGTVRVPVGEAHMASAAAARAWAALCLAAGEPAMAPPAPGAVLAKEAARLALAVGPGVAPAQLLLEVAVLLFAMACRAGGQLARWRAVAMPLAEEASRRLSAECPPDDSAAAARCAAALMSGQPPSAGLPPSRAALLDPDTWDDPERIGLAPAAGASRLRWRVVGYRTAEELWALRVGSFVVYLPAPPVFSWGLEGVALSETAPDLAGEDFPEPH